MKAPIYETPRLKVRPWSDDDAPALFKYASDPDVGVRAGWPPHQGIEESRRVIREIFSNGHTWALELKETGEAIGCIGYYDWKESNIGIGPQDAEVGYWVGRPCWNRGIATEALHLLIDHCFSEKGFHTLWADYLPDNPASGRVLLKCGFRDTGRLNSLSRLQAATVRNVKVMRLDHDDYAC